MFLCLLSVHAQISRSINVQRYTTADNFVPLNLFEQFCNIANLYFLGVGVLQMIPAVSSTHGTPTMYAPLTFIVMVSALRSFKEDRARHRADAARNGKEYLALRHGCSDWMPTQSGKLKVGDIVKVMQNEMIPADSRCCECSSKRSFVFSATLHTQISRSPCNFTHCSALFGQSARQGPLLHRQGEPERRDDARGAVVGEGDAQGVQLRRTAARLTPLPGARAADEEF
jgi:hypothetical protein